jgi:ribosome biogenesis protein ERB1
LKIHLSYILDTQTPLDMPPRTAIASSSKVEVRTNGHAGPSRSIQSTKKRAAPVPVEEEEEDEFDMDGEGLELIGDGDVSESEGVLDEGDDEPFPELDSGSEDGLELDERGGDEDEDSDSPDEALDDEITGSESGYNSSDLDEDDDEDDHSSISSATSPSSSTANLTTDEKLSRMIAKNTIKPNDSIGTDAQISRAKEGKGVLRPSKLVEGGFKREYDDVEAGYGSESSTEDVSGTRLSVI